MMPMRSNEKAPALRAQGRERRDQFDEYGKFDSVVLEPTPVRAVARVLVRPGEAGPVVTGSAIAGRPCVVDVGDDPNLCIGAAVLRRIAYAVAGASGVHVIGRGEVSMRVGAALPTALREVTS
jgi:hypothetical protein